MLAERLAEEIRDGVWTRVLPGSRVLAGRYGVDRKTCDLALSLLTDRRIISPPSQGKRRRILATSVPQNAPPTGHLLLLHSSHRVLDTNMLDFLWKIAGVWHDHSGEAHFERVDYGRYRNPATRLDGLIERHAATAIFMLMPTWEWTQTAMTRLPTYRSGGDGDRSWPVSCSGYSVEQSVGEAARRLVAAGHKRIIAPVEGGWPKLRATLQQGIAQAFGGRHPVYPGDEMVPEFSESVAEAWQGYWRRSFTRLRPTAIILLQETHLLSLYSYCSAAGIRLPDDLSVILLGQSELLAWLRPKPVMATFPYARSVAHFRHWISAGLRPIGHRMSKLEFSDDGETVGPPPKAGGR
ncbi:hypothetical protein Hsar01_02426 [Haloferula sargassicola]|uniref:Transcriptional regulator LacI/GalR-like sensor domain-containing protein n=2 Tax=Haloferula sargassicola TaxID=490096 RepID=A0ABP9UR51_9BACT